MRSHAGAAAAAAGGDSGNGDDSNVLVDQRVLQALYITIFESPDRVDLETLPLFHPAADAVRSAATCAGRFRLITEHRLLDKDETNGLLQRVGFSIIQQDTADKQLTCYCVPGLQEHLAFYVERNIRAIWATACKRLKTAYDMRLHDAAGDVRGLTPADRAALVSIGWQLGSSKDQPLHEPGYLASRIVRKLLLDDGTRLHAMLKAGALPLPIVAWPLAAYTPLRQADAGAQAAAAAAVSAAGAALTSVADASAPAVADAASDTATADVLQPTMLVVQQGQSEVRLFIDDATPAVAATLQTLREFRESQRWNRFAQRMPEYVVWLPLTKEEHAAARGAATKALSAGRSAAVALRKALQPWAIDLSGSPYRGNPISNAGIRPGGASVTELHHQLWAIAGAMVQAALQVAAPDVVMLLNAVGFGEAVAGCLADPMRCLVAPARTLRAQLFAPDQPLSRMSGARVAIAEEVCPGALDTPALRNLAAATATAGFAAPAAEWIDELRLRQQSLDDSLWDKLLSAAQRAGASSDPVLECTPPPITLDEQALAASTDVTPAAAPDESTAWWTAIVPFLAALLRRVDESAFELRLKGHLDRLLRDLLAVPAIAHEARMSATRERLTLIVSQLQAPYWCDQPRLQAMCEAPVAPPPAAADRHPAVDDDIASLLEGLRIDKSKQKLAADAAAASLAVDDGSGVDISSFQGLRAEADATQARIQAAIERNTTAGASTGTAAASDLPRVAIVGALPTLPSARDGPNATSAARPVDGAVAGHAHSSSNVEAPASGDRLVTQQRSHVAAGDGTQHKPSDHAHRDAPDSLHRGTRASLESGSAGAAAAATPTSDADDRAIIGPPDDAAEPAAMHVVVGAEPAPATVPASTAPVPIMFHDASGAVVAAPAASGPAIDAFDAATAAAAAQELLARPGAFDAALASAGAASAAAPGLDAAVASAAAEARLAAAVTMTPSERQAWTGRMGELTAVLLLKHRYSGRSPPVSVRWVNESDETHLPYDIVVEVPQPGGGAAVRLLEVEVKTTSRDARSTVLSLPVSLKELQHHYAEPRHAFLIVWGVHPNMDPTGVGALMVPRINAALPDASLALMLVCDATKRPAGAAATAVALADGDEAREEE